MDKGTLHLVCGKIAAGKSTLCAALAAAPMTVLLSQDQLLSRLYPEEMKTVPDFITYSARLRSAIESHITDLLKIGVSVVLDFPANTKKLRAWMLGMAAAAGAPHLLHYLDVPDEVCRQRLKGRNAAGTHEYQVSDAEFDAITRYFQAPEEEEGLRIVRRG
jgi:predicted kinase